MRTRLRDTARVIGGGQGFSRRAAAATQPASTTTEIEDFQHWIKTSISSAVTPAALRTQVALCGREQLGEMIDVLRDAERDCLTGLQDLNHRTQNEQLETEAQDEQQRISIVYAQNAARWDQRIKWLQDVRVYLQDERQQHHKARGSATAGAARRRSRQDTT